MRHLLVAALTVAACRNASETPRAAGSAGSAAAGSAGSRSLAGGSGSAAAPAAGSAADPWATKPAPPRPPDTPETRKRRAEEALGRVATIKPEVAKIRKLAFRRDVPTSYQPAADFQAFVRREIAKELPAARSRNVSAAFAHLGFLATPVDIATVEEQALTTQAGAYYDPGSKAFFLVMVPDNQLLLDTISAHELTHALQDQHFDLAKYLPSDNRLDDDAASARRFVAEGDATFVMLLYAVHGVIGDQMTPAMTATMRQQIAQFAALDVDALKTQVKQQAEALGALGMDADIKRSIDAMDDIPPIILVPLLDAYMKGALVALTAYEHGGWPTVDKLYRAPPESTEQVLHPETKLFPVREHPHRVTLARATGPELSRNVFGELSWKVYFELWKVPRADEAAEGWGGDRYAVARRPDGRLIGRIATTWDTPRDAEQFATAFVASVAARFPGAETSRPEAGIARSPAGKVFVRLAGNRVFIVDGADNAAELDALVRTTSFQ
jgi:hypothetical protein